LLAPALLSVSLLVFLATGAAPAGDVSALAGIAAAALVAGAALASEEAGRLLGAFAEPLRLLAPLGLALFALERTGGAASDLFPLVLVLLACAALTSRDAGRFLVVGVYAGLALLVAVHPPASLAAARPLALRALWPLAVIVALEVAGRAFSRAPAREAGGTDRTSGEEKAAPLPGAAPEKDSRAEILHDLKSPVTVLRVYTDLVAEAAKRGELPGAEHLAGLSRELSLMESLVGVPVRAPVPAPAAIPPAAARTDLVAVLSSLVESYRAAHGSRIRLEFVAEAPEIPVAADPVALQRAFRNVLDNAVKYTPAGGQVRVRASVVSQHAFVVISDTGAGMTPDEQKHAFTPAWRSPAAVAAGIPGRGIGLGVTKELLEQNGGKISLLSEPGHGLEVTIMFPLGREGRA
jgi:signal transduction histidine kinase